MEFRDNEKDGRSPRWDISQERAFIENLLGQRFNFLLVFFSIFVAGAVNAREAPFLQAVVLSLGAIIALCLMLAIWRTQEKLDLIIAILLKEATHPVSMINNMATGKSRRKLVGYAVPFICFAALAIWAAFAWITLGLPCWRLLISN